MGTLCHKGTTPGQRGVGFLINSNLTDKIREFRGISDRIATLKIEYKKKHFLNLIQIYAPTAEPNQETCEEFYKSLNETINNKPHKNDNQLIIMGDFNSQIGQRESNEERIMGPYNFGKRNDRGKRLVDFCQGNNRKISQ